MMIYARRGACVTVHFTIQYASPQSRPGYLLANYEVLA